MIIKPIPSCPNYYATDRGDIMRNGRRLVCRDNGRGYRQVTVSLGARDAISTRYVHRLVCEAFHGPSPAGFQVRHLNGNRADNMARNLAWSDKATNEADKIAHGTIVRGEGAPNSILTEAQVVEARRRAAAGERYDRIAETMGVSCGVAADAISGRRWAHVPGALPACHSRRRFSDDEVRAIRAQKGARTETDLAADYGVARNTIWQILAGKSYAHLLPSVQVNSGALVAGGGAEG